MPGFEEKEPNAGEGGQKEGAERPHSILFFREWQSFYKELEGIRFGALGDFDKERFPEFEALAETTSGQRAIARSLTNQIQDVWELAKAFAEQPGGNGRIDYEHGYMRYALSNIRSVSNTAYEKVRELLEKEFPPKPPQSK